MEERKTKHLFRVMAGGTPDEAEHDFHVVASDMGKALRVVFARFNAKTSEDLPKPFQMSRVGDCEVGR